PPDLTGPGGLGQRGGAGVALDALAVAAAPAKPGVAQARGAAVAVLAADALVDRVEQRTADVAVGVAADQDLGVLVVVGVGDDRVLVPGAGGPRGRVQDLAAAALVDPDEALVAVDGLGLAVALEVEDRRAGVARAEILAGLRPADPGAGAGRIVAVAVEVEDPIEVAAGRGDLGQAVVVEVADGRRAAAEDAAGLQQQVAV